MRLFGADAEGDGKYSVLGQFGFDKKERIRGIKYLFVR